MFSLLQAASHIPLPLCPAPPPPAPPPPRVQVLACLPPTPWRIDAAEVALRRDLRPARIFSIDPPTARDLDDALSGASVAVVIVRPLVAPEIVTLALPWASACLPACLHSHLPAPDHDLPFHAVEELPGGLYRVGVHIADVSHFVRPGTALDSEAQQRSTSGAPPARR